MKLESGAWCDFCKGKMDYKDIYADGLQPNKQGNLCIDCRLKMQVLFNNLETYIDTEKVKR